MIVIPMAGRSQRFFDAGYDWPKFMLDLADGASSHAVESFAGPFATHPFLFILGPDAQAEAFVRSECGRLGIGEVAVVRLSGVTAGQAETVERAWSWRAPGRSAPDHLQHRHLPAGLHLPPRLHGL